MSTVRGSEKSKFISYFNLWDAFNQPGCPICTLAERDSFRFLDALLYERVNDVGTREGLRKALGFCNWHAWKAQEVGNCALGLGIIYEDILNRIYEHLRKIRHSFPLCSRGSFWRRIFPGKKPVSRAIHWESSNFCPACRHVQLLEGFYLEILLDYISEKDFAGRFSRSAGICFRHLEQIRETFPRHKNLPLLIEKQLEKFEALRKEVAEFVRKQDFKYTHEPRGGEIDSWRRALEMVSGKREIFSNQVIRGRRGAGRISTQDPSISTKRMGDEGKEQGKPNEEIGGLGGKGARGGNDYDKI